MLSQALRDEDFTLGDSQHVKIPRRFVAEILPCFEESISNISMSELDNQARVTDVRAAMLLVVARESVAD